jgi:hypothetical protein
LKKYKPWFDEGCSKLLDQKNKPNCSGYRLQVGLKVTGTHQLLVYDDDVNLLGDYIDTIKKNTQTLIDASKVVGLEVNAEKTKYMLLSYHQNEGQNHGIKI